MYITNHNLNKVIKCVAIDDNFDKDIFEGINTSLCLSKAEEDDLRRAELFFSSNNLGTKLEFTPLKDKEDTYTYLFEKNNAAYHKSASCKRLNSNWINFYIPKEVKEKGIDAIIRFRNLIRGKISNDGSIEDTALILSLKAEFGISDLNFGRVERQNTQIVNFSEVFELLALEEINQKLKQLLHDISEFPTKSELHKKIYNLRYWEPNKLRRIEKYKDPQELKIANDLADLKIQLVTGLIISFRKKHNFDQEKLEEQFLLGLNFNKCSECFTS